MRFTIFLILLSFITISYSFGQSFIKVGVQANAIPTLRINSASYSHRTSQGIKLLVSDFSNYSPELGIYLYRGYDTAVDFSYGLIIGYLVFKTKDNFFKAGLNVGRFKLNDYKQSYEAVGDEIEDSLPTTFKPYIAWEWEFLKSLSVVEAFEIPMFRPPLTPPNYSRGVYKEVFQRALVIKSGYRLMISETETITEIISTRPDGSPLLFQSTEKSHIYGSAFELGAGLNFSF